MVRLSRATSQNQVPMIAPAASARLTRSVSRSPWEPVVGEELKRYLRSAGGGRHSVSLRGVGVEPSQRYAAAPQGINRAARSRVNSAKNASSLGW